MCGRFVAPDQASIEREWGLTHPQAAGALAAAFAELSKVRYDVRPTTRAIILRNPQSGEIETAAAKWGLVPCWWKQEKPPASTFNARSEDAAGKPMWRDAYRKARCLVPVKGWYEWRVESPPGSTKPMKQRYFMRRKDRGLIYLAGLYSDRTNPVTGECELTYTILTRAAAGRLAEFHDRMPVIFSRDVGEEWLDPKITDKDRVGQMIRDLAEEDFEVIPVGKDGLTESEDLSASSAIEPNLP